MSEIDRAIDRAEETWSQNLSSGETRQAYADRAILAAEVKRLRESLESASAPTVGAHNRAVAQRRFQ